MVSQALSSSEDGAIDLKICYANSVEEEQLCKRVNPKAIRRMSK